LNALLHRPTRLKHVLLTPRVSQLDVDHRLLEGFNGAVDTDQLLLKTALVALDSDGPGVDRQLLESVVDLKTASLQVLQGLKTLLFRHEPRARRVLSLLFLNFALNLLVFARFVVPVDVTRHIAIVQMELGVALDS
jgi:hypothetical protein